MENSSIPCISYFSIAYYVKTCGAKLLWHHNYMLWHHNYMRWKSERIQNRWRQGHQRKNEYVHASSLSKSCEIGSFANDLDFVSSSIESLIETKHWDKTMCRGGPSIKYVTLEEEGIREGVTVCDRGRGSRVCDVTLIQIFIIHTL